MKSDDHPAVGSEYAAEESVCSSHDDGLLRLAKDAGVFAREPFHSEHLGFGFSRDNDVEIQRKRMAVSELFGKFVGVPRGLFERVAFEAKVALKANVSNEHDRAEHEKEQPLGERNRTMGRHACVGDGTE